MNQNEKLGTYALWASGFEKNDLDRRLKDRAHIKQALLNDGNIETRNTPHQPTPAGSDITINRRDSLEFTDWNDNFGFFGTPRPKYGPGHFGHLNQQANHEPERLLPEAPDDGF